MIVITTEIFNFLKLLLCMPIEEQMVLMRVFYDVIQKEKANKQ